MDLYTLLGVTRAASADEIERAYRRLARRYHPGINPGDRVAETLFRQVEEAFQVLSDLERRREYDRDGAPPVAGPVEATIAFAGFDFSAPAEGPEAATFAELFADVFQEAAREATSPTRGVELETTLRLSFEEAVRGGDFPLSIIRQDRCVACAGDGRVPLPPRPCPRCEGQGSGRWARGHLVFTKVCEMCGGSGRLSHQACRTCAGTGVSPRSEVATVRVPPGLETGARIAVPGRGHAGARGGPAGDLYVTVDVASHPFFRRDGRDLLVTLPVAVHEAALGARVDVPTLDGPVRLRIPPGTPAGRRFRIPGRGVPAAHRPGDSPPAPAGDLIVEVQIVLPSVRDERSRELLKEFGRLNSADVRKHFFEER